MNRAYWLAWGVATVVSSAYLAAVLTTDAVGTQAMFLPGETTAGHYQIEVACASCHTPFQGVTNDACLACHERDLAAGDDSHPASKFRDPRNAGLLARLDATKCVTCHREHAPAMTRPMGVTLPDDYCFTCHAEVGRDRPSHTSLDFVTCASAGCHNYHDNTALYEDFLVARAAEPAVSHAPRVAPSALRDALRVRTGTPVVQLPRLASDAPPAVTVAGDDLTAWEATAHARAGVNCTGCHAADSSNGVSGKWLNRPTVRVCAGCHDTEAAGFFGGRHGMRLGSDLSPMTPAMARLPMKADTRDRELSCLACHGAHEFDRGLAATKECAGCHDDRHTSAYVSSPHFALWQAEQDGRAATGTGVSCATCHLPRVTERIGRAEITKVEHNQNANLRPNEKMARTVCLACHGLGFSLDALADRALVDRNFTGQPRRSVGGIEMAVARSDGSKQRSTP